jgi:hypothetical protein
VRVPVYEAYLDNAMRPFNLDWEWPGSVGDNLYTAARLHRRQVKEEPHGLELHVF